ncbi:cobalt-precorrin 5A acetaldehyde-lyase [Hathewaya proteolytica DSM 3090]|uniref:Cobalt-precorrin 5A acetaldehyde-lyase n=1 Tax=Hathewaya proteolytica DSM 3090 TaxID=1121331 RepID=A0A1M6Q4D0_9CLOT|nr:cobalt-precorrin 5A hydrolase [Hathewaya proteolytica]SHK15011.1 cobalt-precorrin 5A acetaldehyde-lyase [Hathewaya proteolytica DSM 3090]
MDKIAVICVTDHGDEISDKIKEKLCENYKVEVFKRETTKTMKIKNVVSQVFQKVDYIIFISSTGIAVRSIAEFINSKTSDPGVVVIDNKMQYAISLIGGHLGGANGLCQELYEKLGVTPIITTATDNLNITAPDIFAKDNNLIIEDMKKCKDIAASLVNGERVAFIWEHSEILPKGYLRYNPKESYKGVVVVTNKREPKVENAFCVLKLIQKNIVLGIGCRKDYSGELMIENTRELLKTLNIDERSVKSIATAWVKENESAIKELSDHLNCPMVVFQKDEIEKFHLKYQGSDFVMKTIGVRAVCQPCVELLGGRLITDKICIKGMTISIGQII